MMKTLETVSRVTFNQSASFDFGRDRIGQYISMKLSHIEIMKEIWWLCARGQCSLFIYIVTT